MKTEKPEEDKISCYTPAKGRDGVVRIPSWKYNCVRRAILDAVEESEDGTVVFGDLAAIAVERLTSNQLAKLGSVKWHVTTVKLNMEVDGEIERVPRRKPQALRKPL